MTKNLAILVVHGMGFQEIGYADPLIKAMNHQVAATGKDPGTIAWKSVFWQDLLAARQKQYLREAKKKNDLDYVRLRRFIVGALGDAVAYQNVGGGHQVYQRIHQRVGEAMTELYTQDLTLRSVPLVVMAHSLGGHIMSNYVWDMQRRPPADLASFERMETLTGFITFGSNIPLFTFAHDDVQPIDFPPATLPPPLRKKARWLNFYDPDDVLGYPLKCINEAYDRAVSNDIAIDVGNFMTSWNPGSHSHYWTDRDFTGVVAKFLARLL